MGHTRVTDLLPPLVAALRDEGRSEMWACDPMHGNTFTASGGQKTRHFNHVLAETAAFFSVHRDLGTWPGGLHIELTGDNVTECLGGGDNLDETHLDLNYTSMCDPRLNATQALDLAFCATEYLQGYSTSQSV
jgi:3-deoxy-7-phosphoheptulonate synthase